MAVSDERLPGKQLTWQKPCCLPGCCFIMQRQRLRSPCGSPLLDIAAPTMCFRAVPCCVLLHLHQPFEVSSELAEASSSRRSYPYFFGVSYSALTSRLRSVIPPKLTVSIPLTPTAYYAVHAAFSERAGKAVSPWPLRSPVLQLRGPVAPLTRGPGGGTRHRPNIYSTAVCCVENLVRAN